MTWDKPLCGQCKRPINTPSEALLMAAALSATYWHVECWEQLKHSEQPMTRLGRLLHTSGPMVQASESSDPSSSGPSQSRRSRQQDLVVKESSRLVLAGALLEAMSIIALFILFVHIPLPLPFWGVFLLLGFVPFWMASPSIFWLRLVVVGAVSEGLFIMLLFVLLNQSLSIPPFYWVPLMLLGVIPLWMVASPAIYWFRLGRLQRSIEQYEMSQATDSPYQS